jgi:hypothetical protein
MDCVLKYLATHFRTSVILAVVLLALSAPAAIAYPRVGVIDGKGRTVIQCEFRNVQYLGQGFFFADDFNPEHPLKYSNTGRVLDYNGKTIPTKLPRGCTLSKVWLPDASENNEHILTSLPADTIFEIHGQGGFGLCDLNGNIILEPTFGAIGIPRKGFFPISTGLPFCSGALLFIWDSKTKERKSAPDKVMLFDLTADAPIPFQTSIKDKRIWGYMDLDGKVLIEPKFEQADAFFVDGLAWVQMEGRIDPAYIDKEGKEITVDYRHVVNYRNSCIVLVAKNGERKLGSLDNHSKFLIEPEYIELKRLSDDVYAGRKSSSDQFLALNSHGNVLFTFPAETQRVVRLSDDLIDCVIKTETGESLFVSIDLKGKTVRRARNPETFFLEHGFAVEQIAIDNAEKQLKLLDRNDRIVQPAQACKFVVLTEDRLLKYVSDDHFKSSIWENPNPIGLQWGLNRQESFASFLKDFDLIGMTKERIEALLGPSQQSIPNGAFYYISYPGCFHSQAGFQVEFEKGKVSRWREVWNAGDEIERTTPWITQNMVVRYDANYSHKPKTEPPITLILKEKR